eukprot:CAMPEP_0178418646 /NCGR_PEP_ID=MMETSP0689_2-20121128/25197_1 /TAXON_ID=160604 /ORGANISM="Amphidinium massartii, Strain CS-259" /LENGTH=851 /DNA_ID=CAMNT_0020040049 /DNA_START=346 /DNA_END=2901 /DNA_ORIENTATION=-
MASLNDVLEAAKEGERVASLDATGSEATHGVITGGQQGKLWFANIYPTKAFRFDIRQMFTHRNHTTLIPELMPPGVQVLKILPREREGGAFVVFRASPSLVAKVLMKEKSDSTSSSSAGHHIPHADRWLRKGGEDILGKVCLGISNYLRHHSTRAFLCGLPIRAHQVLGKPFMEDLKARYPSKSLLIKIEPPSVEIHEDEIFKKLRPYGTLDDLRVLEGNKGFRANFCYAAAAVAARNCLHRARIEIPGGTASAGEEPKGGATTARLYIEFEETLQRWLRDFIANHSRIAVPTIVILVGSAIYMVWESIRRAFVQLRLATALQKEADHNPRRMMPYFLWKEIVERLSASQAVASTQWLTTRLVRREKKCSTPDLLEAFWAGRDEEVAELRRLLSLPQDRLILLTGPRGNGQESFVHHEMQGRAVFIDVSNMLEAGVATDDSAFVWRLCTAFGVFPPPIFDRQVSALMDLALPGSGSKGRDGEVMGAVRGTLSTVSQALTTWKKRRTQSHPEKAYVPPLFVIEGFTAENRDLREGFFELLSSWGAYMSEAGLARVMFIADSTFAEASILTSVRDRPERVEVIQLPDAPQSSVRLILSEALGAEVASELSDEDLKAIGGRFRDITALVRHVQSGVPPKEAVARLLESAFVSLRGNLIGSQPGVKWTRCQLWKAVKLLNSASATDGKVPVDVFLWHVFRGDEAAMQSMSRSGLIAFHHGEMGNRGQEDRRTCVTAGSPLYAASFRHMAAMEGTAAVLDVDAAKEDIQRDSKLCVEYEEQLARIRSLEVEPGVFAWICGLLGWGASDPIYEREEQLMQLIAEQHKKIESAHKVRRAALKVLQRRRQEGWQASPAI